MKSSRRAFLAAASAAAMSSPFAARAQAASKVKFVLDWRFEGPAALFLMGNKGGHYAREKLDVTIDVGSGSGAAIQRVASGAYDIGFADINSLIEFIGNNPNIPPDSRPVAVYMVYQTLPAAVFALKKSGISKPADLNGKTMGGPVFDAGRKAFPMFAKANGIDMAKTPWKSMDPPLREVMLVKGQVDAVVAFRFVGQLALNAQGIKDEDLVVMPYRDFGVDLYSSTVIVNPRFARTNPEAVRAFLRGPTSAIKDCIANPEVAVQSVKDRDPLIDVPMELKRLKMCIDSAVVTPSAKVNGLGAIDKLRLDSTIDQVVAAFGIKNSVSPDGLFDSSYLPSSGSRRI